MLDLFAELKSTVLRRRAVHIDNAIFRLHWMVTPALFVSFAAILTARQYVGQPIDCMLETHIIPASMINTYCWISHTFLIPSAFTQKVGIDVPHPGVDNSYYVRRTNLASSSSSSSSFINPLSFANNGGVIDKSSDRKYYPYYQWICFVLFIQAIIFYLPHYIWKTAEGGLMASLSMDLRVALMSEEERAHKRKLLADYLLHHLHMFNSYVYKYFFCELLCLVNVLTQTIATDIFLDGQFILYGLSVLRQNEYFAAYLSSTSKNDTIPHPADINSINPFIFVFPRMTKCTFHYFGSSGDVQRKDALCLLPLNVFHEKVYLFVWFWFAALIALSAAVAVIRLVMIIAVPFRAHILKTRASFCAIKHLRAICRRGDLGDFFILYQLAKNIDPIVMQEVVYEIGKRMTRHDNYSSYKGGDSGGGGGSGTGGSAKSGSSSRRSSGGHKWSAIIGVNGLT